MIVVADASPLIFLAKVRQLGIVFRSTGRDVRVPKQVSDEVLVPGADPAELRELESFLERCKVEAVRRPRQFASGMSGADNAALTLAVRANADFLLCDERIIRMMAEAEGVRPLGTLGVLLRAARLHLLSAGETKVLVDRLVQDHGFRIGIELYRAVLRQLEELDSRE